MVVSGLPITAHQAEVAARALDQEEARRRHLLISLTGAHAYGFPSPDSDLDLKGVHVEPTARLLGLSPPASHAGRLEIIDGVEIDYASNEVGQVVAGLLGGNGSLLERVLGMWPVRSAPEHGELAALARSALSRRYFKHYQGFATGILREVQADAAPTAKRVLYVLRTALTGAHLMMHGEVVTDLTALIDEHGFASVRELVALKKTRERVPLQAAERDHWLAEAARALAKLEASPELSALPEEPANRAEAEAWLLALRRSAFG